MRKFETLAVVLSLPPSLLLFLLAIQCLSSRPLQSSFPPSLCYRVIQSLLAENSSWAVAHEDKSSPAAFTLTQRDPQHPEAGMEVISLDLTKKRLLVKRANLYKQILTSLFNHSSLPVHKVTFLLNSADICCQQVKVHNLDLPTLSLCVEKEKKEKCGHVGIVPSYSTHVISEIPPDSGIPALWKDKIDKVVWRGSPTGFGPLTNRTRFRSLVKLSSLPDVDACFSRFHHSSDDPKKDLELLTHLGIACPQNQTEFHEFARYRYVLDMDGNSWSDRFIHLLSLGSTVIKQAPKFDDAVTLKARPYIHYIPVKSDMSNMEDVLRHCRSNPTYCQKVAENGVRFVKEEFNEEKRKEIWISQLIAYHKKCNPDDHEKP
jgi:hypothetical protein